MASLTVLGIGNILLGDEGLGVRLMEAVRDGRPWPADMEFVDGGVGGLNLLNVLERSGRLIVFDAAQMQLSPGEYRIITPDQLAREGDERLSLHEMPFVETYELCRQFLTAPVQVGIFAVQPGDISPGRSLSEPLKSAWPALSAAAADFVHRRYAGRW